MRSCVEHAAVKQSEKLERESITTVMGVPEDAPVLIEYLLLEDLDLCLDMKKGLIYNPDDELPESFTAAFRGEKE